VRRSTARGLGASKISSRKVEERIPSTQTWLLTGPLIQPRKNHGAMLVNDGTVLIAGGSFESPSPARLHLPSVDVRRDIHARFVALREILTLRGCATRCDPRHRHGATEQIPAGRVLFCRFSTLERRPHLGMEPSETPICCTFSPGNRWQMHNR